MNRELPRTVTPEEIKTYRDDGIVCMRGMFDDEWVRFLRDAVLRDMESPSRMVVDATRAGTGKFFGDTFVWDHLPELRRFIDESPAADIAGALMGSKKVNLFFDQFLVKAPSTSTRTVWHHDLTYWPVDGTQICTLWVALDRVTAETGAVEYVAGSHRWGERYQPRAFKDHGLYEKSLPDVPDIDAMRGELRIIQPTLEPGDCTVHHGLTVHGAPGNASATEPRRAYIVRWAGDDAVYHPRPGIQPMLYDPDIAPGGPIDCALFPVVRPRASTRR